jgi:UDP-2,3-diacylglucosamine pyrophosphatase LpxH
VVRNIKVQGFDGVICGHIHAAAMHQVDGMTYFNCGDWVDSCTAIIEHTDGRMELLEWGALAPGSVPTRSPIEGEQEAQHEAA